MADPIMPDKDLANLMEQLSRVRNDKDRVRLVNAAAQGFRFSCAQLAQLVGKAHFGASLVAICTSLHAKLSDPEDFEAKVVAKLPFDEDRVQVRAALGLAK